jgi:hypothetical protein
MSLRPSRVLWSILGAAVLGFAVFAILAAQFALRGSGFDMKQLGLTPGHIAGQGPGVILDETTAAGDRLLVWAE